MSGGAKKSAAARGGKQEVDSEALRRDFARARAAYRISYASAVLALSCNVAVFAAGDTFQLLRRLSDTPLGVSVSADALMLVFFAFGLPVWGILRFKAWACAGAAAVVAYSIPDASAQAWAYCAASTALGACTLRLGPALSAAAGAAALASSLWFYSVFFS